MSTTFKKIVLGSVAVSATTFMALGATPVQAAQLTGTLDISSGSAVHSDENSLDFVGDGEANIIFGTGDFQGLEGDAFISDIFDIAGLSEEPLEEFFIFDGLSVDLIGGSVEQTTSGGWSMDFDGIAYLDDFDATNVHVQFTTQLSNPSSWSATITAKSVPEPATMAGLSMVAVGMALAGRRKKA